MSHIYRIREHLEEIEEMPWAEGGPRSAFVAVMTPEEAAADAFLRERTPLFTGHAQEIRFCKAEAHVDFLYGTIWIPARGKRKRPISFYYAIFSDRIYLIEEGGFALGQIRKLQDKAARHNMGLGYFFSDFLDLLTDQDLLYLTGIENQFVQLEDEVLSGSYEDFNHRIMGMRREILVYSHYYLQLSDVSNVLQQNDLGFFSTKELNAFRLFSERVARLHGEAVMLREYSTQIREVYQAQIDLRQNRIMKTLTVVTTVFMPLTLLVGWYGMNLEMPEFGWKYGYPAFVLLCILAVGVSVRLCKQKHYL